MRRLRILTTICCAVAMLRMTAVAAPLCHVTSYYETAWNEPLHHVCGILQDRNGMIWIATWGGMFSFDGMTFTIHEEQETKTLGIAPGHSRGVEPCPTGDAWQRLGTPREFRFQDPYGTPWRMSSDGHLFYADAQGREHPYHDVASSDGNASTVATGSGLSAFDGYRGCFLDRQQNLWVLCYYAIHKVTFSKPRLTPVVGCEDQPVRCMHRFADGSYWLCQRYRPRVVLYDAQGTLVGYLTRDGQVSPRPADFHGMVYCLHEQADGTVWLGTKGTGAYRLTPQPGGYAVTPITSATAEGKDIYAIGSDRQGRVWLATLYGGVLCLTPQHLAAPQPTAQPLRHYPYEQNPRAHYLDILGDTLVVSTSEGLLVADLSTPVADDVTFRSHHYDASAPLSLSSNLTSHAAFDHQGRLLVCTENGGINLCTSSTLLADRLQFRHVDNTHGLPDIAFCLTEVDDRYWATSLYSLSSFRLDDRTGHTHVMRFGPDFFGGRYRLAEIPPLVLDSTRWILSTEKGAMFLDPRELRAGSYVPRLVLTLYDNGGDGKLKYTAIPDTIVLAPDQRSFRLQFAALDYTHPEGHTFVYRVRDIDTTWISLGNSRTISFADIAPGHHVLEVCTTGDQERDGSTVLTTVLDVTPRFSETVWALLLLILLTSAVGCAVVWTVVYVRRIKRKHNEMLAAYLSVIGKRETVLGTIGQDTAPTAADDQFVTRLTAYINQHLSDSELRTEMMADYMSVSLSTLTRNTKSLMGVTPGEFLAKARIRKAELTLLQQRHLTISEVAYHCGFSDPKYFSRCFKQETKLSPSEYRSRHNEPAQ